MVDVGGLVTIVGMAIIARLVGREYVLVPLVTALIDQLDPTRGALVGAVAVIIMGGLGKTMELH